MFFFVYDAIGFKSFIAIHFYHTFQIDKNYVNID